MKVDTVSNDTVNKSIVEEHSCNEIRLQVDKIEKAVYQEYHSNIEHNFRFLIEVGQLSNSWKPKKGIKRKHICIY